MTSRTVLDRIAALTRAAMAADHRFEVWRTDDEGERFTVLIAFHELTGPEIVALSPEERTHFEADSERWVRVDAEIERVAAEDDRETNDHEAAVHGGEPRPETLAECIAEEAAKAA